MNPVEQIQQLVGYLNFHTMMYDEGNPLISDTDWDKAYFELQELGEGSNQFGINLAEAYTAYAAGWPDANKLPTSTKLVTNEMCATLKVVSMSGAEIVTIDAYSEDDNDAGFKLFTGNAITAKEGNNQYAISNMFDNAYLKATLDNATNPQKITYNNADYALSDGEYRATDKTDYFKKVGGVITYFYSETSVGMACTPDGTTLKFAIPTEIKNLYILGITSGSTAPAAWVNKASVDVVNKNVAGYNLFAKIYVPNADGGETEYQVYNPTYVEAAASTAVYTITEDFYVIKSTSGAVVVSKSDYATIYFNSNSGVSNQSKTSNIVTVYEMSSVEGETYKLLKKELATGSAGLSINEITTTSAGDNEIKISNNDLKAYKEETNSTAEYLYTTYKITYTTTVGSESISTTVTLNVRFEIPETFPVVS